MDDSWNQSGIYMLTCKINGKRYIGQSKNIKRRLNEHKNFDGHSPLIHNAIAKYGWENFEPTVLEFCPVEKLDEREIYYISELKPEYNLAKGGLAGNRGYKFSEETRQKLKEIAVNYKAIHQKKVRCVETGIVFNSIQEAAAVTGIKNPNYISDALHGRLKSTGGFHWQLVEVEPPPKRVPKKPQKNPLSATRQKRFSSL